MSVRATLPRIHQLVDEHPCKFKPVYYSMFVEPVRDALRAAGVEVEDPVSIERGVIARFEWPDGKRCRVLVDYADQVHVDGLVRFAMEQPSGEFDLVAKMKPCDRFAQEYAEYPRPVVPWGYLIAPTHSGEALECIADRAWFLDALENEHGTFSSSLREMQDQELSAGGGPNLVTRGVYHAKHHCPERMRFFDPELFDGEKTDVGFRDHIAKLARSGAMLNLCGPDNTIDRKVVEACAIGVPIVSNDGLKDLRLPWGRRFVHGENVWFVNSIEEVKRIARDGLPRETRKVLSAGGRALYEACFRPASVGQWMVQCAREHAR